jgi:probable HAF family extracellular repeat protein
MAIQPISRRTFFFGALAVAAVGRTGRVRARQSAPSYSIAELPVLSEDGFGIGAAYGINETADVVGWSGTGIQEPRPTRWRKNKPEAAGAADEFGRAYAINKGRRIAGVVFASAELRPPVATVWMKGEGSSLPSLGGDGNVAFAINDKNAIVGWSQLQPGDRAYHACLWTGGKVTDLGGLGGDSLAFDINDAGQIVGLAHTEPGQLYALDDLRAHNALSIGHAVLWQDGAPTDLGTLGGDVSIALAINDDGVVVGTSAVTTGDSTTFAFRWRDGEMTALGDLPDAEGFPSSAYDVNAAGQIVGTVHGAGLFGAAVLWEDDTAIDLSTLIPPRTEWAGLSAAWGINDAGQIVGEGVLRGGAQGFILTPEAS